MSHATEITVAVCFDETRRVAGIAGTHRGGRIVSGDIVRCSGPAEAHVLAILRQAEITAKPSSGPARIFTSSELAVSALAGEAVLFPPSAHALLTELRGLVDSLGDKLTVEMATSEGTRRAFIAARQTYKAWVAGLEGGSETWRPGETAEKRRAARWPAA